MIQIFQNSIGLQLANNQGGVYRTSLEQDTTTIFPITFTSKCLTVLKIAYEHTALTSNNVLFKEWCVTKVTKSSFVTKSTNPATSMMYITLGV